MNVNEISSKMNVRLNRIKFTSRVLRTIYILFLLGIVAQTIFNIFHFWWTHETDTRRIFSNGFFSVLSNLSYFSRWQQVCIFLQFILLFIFYWYVFKLLNLFQKGLIFTPQNVHYIKYLAIITLAKWFIHFVSFIFGIVKGGFWPRLVSPEYYSPLLWTAGFFLIAWIMDEGRKIKEEQELTV